jgi:membrane protein
MGVVDRLRERVRGVRDRQPAVDHAVRAYDRHVQVRGSQVAASITYYGFLSFFPLVALAFSVLGYVSHIFPNAQENIESAIEDYFPSLFGSGPGQIDIDDIVDARVGAGIIGLVGLLYAGLGWVDAMRSGLRRIFGTMGQPVPFLRRKGGDVVVLLLLGLAVLGSTGLSGFATTATSHVLGLAGLDGSLLAAVLLRVLTVALTVLLDAVVLAILFTRLPGARLTWRQLRSGVLLGAIGLEVLKLVGTYLVARTTHNPVYATFGVVVGLLVWINLLSQVLVYAAAWTATQAYSLVPGAIGQPGTGRATGLAAATDPVTAVAPGDYEPVPPPVRDGSAGGASGRRRTLLRGAAVGAAIGALLARTVRRRGPRA